MDRWNHRLARGGPRLTGNAAHTAYVDWLADQLDRTGLHVRRDRLTFTRWEPHRWALDVEGEPVEVAFYFPYSGETPRAGITAPLVWLGPAPASSAAFAAAAGAIAVVEVATPQLPIGAVFPETGRYASDMDSPELLVPAPGVSDVALAPLLDLAVAAGVAGVVCIRTGASDELSADQYAPFTTGYAGVPALWLGPTAGAQVRQAALLGRSATLVLDATLTPGAATETIWAELRGHGRETVVVNTHTDGPNVAEENGGLGLLALARQYAAVPRSQRGRNLMFLATTGHFQLAQFGLDGGQSASQWLAAHPEQVDGTHRLAVAALTLEHLGCREWLDDPLTNTYAASGRKDVAYCFSNSLAMRDLYLAAAEGTSNNRTITAQPAFYFGEGHDFDAAGIPTASLIPAMTYLVAAPPRGAIEKLDPRYMRGQIQTFSHLVRALDDVPTDQLVTLT